MTSSPWWAWEPHPDAWLLATLLLGGYVYALAAWGPRFAPGRRAASPAQRLSFTAGVLLMWLAADWPLDQLADLSFAWHMVQHLVFMFLAAPLLILGTPAWLLRRLLAPAAVQRVARSLTSPFVALLIVNVWVAGYHWPALVELSVRNDLAHFGVHVLWMLTGLLMWWPVLSPLPELPHPSYPVRMGYLFGQSLLPTIPASFLTFGEGVLYSTYARTASQVGLDPVVDQQIAGLTMKIGGGMFLWAVICALFFRWSYEEQTGAPDLFYWHDHEPALRAHLSGSRQEPVT